MNELKNQLQLVETELRTEQQLGAMADQAKITELQEKYQAILTQISQAEQKQREGAIEEKVHAEEIPFAVAGIDFTGLPAEVIKLIDAVVKTDRRRILNEHTTELEQMEKGSEEREHQLQWQNEELQKIIENGTADNKRLIGENGDLRDHSFKQHEEIEDLRSKLANAAVQLAEKDVELTRLQSQVEEYQRAKVYGERQAQQIIDVTPDESSSINAALDAVKKMYAKIDDWGSVMKVTKPDGTFELATRQEVAEQWEAADGQNSFRSEDHSTVTESDTVPTAEEESVITAPTFQDAGQEPVDSGAPSQDGQVDAETIEARVAALELVVFGQAKVAA